MGYRVLMLGLQPCPLSVNPDIEPAAPNDRISGHTSDFSFFPMALPGACNGTPTFASVSCGPHCQMFSSVLPKVPEMVGGK